MSAPQWRHAPGSTRRRWQRRAGVVALALAIIGACNPRWGSGDPDGVAIGRDIVLVLDFSKSMLAEDAPGGQSRARAAVQSAQALVQHLRTRRGDRVGLVLFAARPMIVAPLTTDLDHLAAMLGELDATHPPADIEAGDATTPSGTRIGGALALAATIHDPRFPGFQDIILLTDADDPANDQEWQRGTTAARAVKIPVHVVGFGDATRDSTITLNGELLEGYAPDGLRSPIQTRLHEDVAGAIAAAGGGTYRAMTGSTLEFIAFFQSEIEAMPTREVDDDHRPQRKLRAGVFYALAVMLLAASVWKRRVR